MTDCHRVRVLLGVVVTLTALTLVGCAGAGNTLQQEYVFDMGRLCEASGEFNATGLRVDRVSPDGRTYWTNAVMGPFMREIPLFQACVRNQITGHPYLDWAKAQKREASQPLVAVGATAATASTSSVPTSSGPVMVPVWQVGDEWQYAYKNPTSSGTYVWSVDRVEAVEGVQHYVVKSGSREIYLRVSDLAFSIERVDGVIVSRDTPSRLNFSFPLTVGKTWEQTYRQERPVDRTTTDRDSQYAVDVEESVTLLAGTFRTLKISWRNKKTNALFYEMWYAPDVKQWVKIREVLSNGIRERELIAFKLRQP